MAPGTFNRALMSFFAMRKSAHFVLGVFRERGISRPERSNRWSECTAIPPPSIRVARAARCGKIAGLVASVALGIETGDFPEECVDLPGIPESLDAGVREVDPRASEAPTISGRRWAVRASFRRRTRIIRSGGEVIERSASIAAGR
jgi:hypothetical protein